MKALSPLCRLVWLATLIFALAPELAWADSDLAQWIWSPAQTKDQTPPGAVCYFRKTFELGPAESAQLEITADQTYELYVNARQVGSGENWKVLDRFDLTQYLTPGKNTIAVQVKTVKGGPAGLAARLLLKPQGGTQIALVTDKDWKTSLKEAPKWIKADFDDSTWIAAQSFGPLGGTLPWGNETHLAGNEGRFRVQSEFQIDQVAEPEQTGSLIAMAFNEFGQIIAARENGPVLRISDEDGDGVRETVETYCDEVKNCQGLLAINGTILAIGDGPDGVAMYRLSDTDQDRTVDRVEPLLHFEGPMREHGAHALTLGPDGLVYIVVGNHATIDKAKHQFAPTSPLREYYEGDLAQPRYEDPGGHAVGIKAPAGTILRTDVQGRFVELVAGGLRNPYDLAFNRQGDLFTFDSDMEWDLGTPWYWPTRLQHVVPGAEFGWRSGWANWPSYYLDGLAATADLGAGSPTGVVFYNHVMFPLRFHNAMIACDWSRGRINVIRMEPEGGSYKARSSVLVEGRPLNATDVEIGPDGCVYFCTGGRDTEGGIYRVAWTGSVPPQVTDLGTGIEPAIRQPQLDSAWARQRVAKVRQSLGEQWEPELLKIARDPNVRPERRLRTLDLMQLFGPFPPIALLIDLTADKDPQIRAKAAYLLGIHHDELSNDRLVRLLDDPNATVRRQACESLSRVRYETPPAKLLDLLSDKDRHVAFAARRALERLPVAQWQMLVMADPRTRVFLHGATALLTVSPKRETAVEVLNRCELMLDGKVNDPAYPPGFISDHDFTDLLRVVELGLLRGELTGDELPTLRKLLAREYPSSDAIMNRELVRLLVTMQEPSITPQLIEQLQAELPEIEKVHIAVHAPLLKQGWTTEQRMELVKYYEQARTLEGGQNFARYIDNCSRDLMASFTRDEQLMVMRNGGEWPGCSLWAMAALPEELDAETIEAVIEMDRQVSDKQDATVERLRTGVIAVLGRSRTPEAMAYLREVYEKDTDRREMIAVGLAQDPSGENWPILVRTLSIVEGPLGGELLRQLTTVDQRPEEPEALRQVILCGLRLKDKGAVQATMLLQHWTGVQPVADEKGWEHEIAAWQAWFRQKYPDQPAPELPVEAEASKWTYQELLSYLSGESAEAGDPSRGALVFEQAQCVKCHRYGSRGESIGPDLTTISRRFQKKEILQSIIFPSHVISDQYASKSVLTTDGRMLIGLVAPASDDTTTILQNDGTKLTLAKDEIDQIEASTLSAMPEGLLDPLSLEQIADLFSYLTEPPRNEISSRREEQQR